MAAIDTRAPSRLPARWLWPARLAWLALVGLMAWLYVGDLRTSLATAGTASSDLAWQVVMPVGFAAISAVIFLRKSNEWMGLLTSFALFSVGVYLLTSVGDNVVLRPGWQLPGGLLLGLTSASFVLLVFVFPDGRIAPSRLRLLVSMIVGLPSIAFLAGVLFGLPSEVGVSAFIAAIAIGFVFQIYRYRRLSGPLERQQTKWVIVGLLAPVVVTLWYFAVVAPNQARIEAAGWYLASILVSIAVVTLLPLSIALSILRYRLWDIDVLINRALVYGVLSALLALGYLGSVVVLQGLFNLLAGQSQPALVTVLSTLLLAAVAAPLRRRLQALIDRRFYRRQYDAARTLASFSLTLREDVDLQQLSDRLRQVVEDTMQPAHANIWLKSDAEAGRQGGPD